MDDFVVWIIIIGFYAPLHYLLPALILFITGQEDEDTRKRLIRRALFDSTLSMVLAFGVVIGLVYLEQMYLGMFILLASMFYPFVRIWLHRREIAGKG